MDTQGYITLKEAAKRYGRTYDALRKAAQRGTIPSKVVFGLRLVLDSDVAAYVHGERGLKTTAKGEKVCRRVRKN